MTWYKQLLFMRTFFRKPIQVGSVTPSTRAVAERILQDVDWTRIHTIVELGAGLGPITAVVEERRPAHVQFVAFEREGSFREVLKERFPDLPLYPEASEMRSVLNARQIPYADIIISAIPLSILSPDEKDTLLRQVTESLAPDGTLMVLQYWTAIGGRLNRHFERVSRSIVLRNLPPAVIFRCEQVRQEQR